MPKILLDCNNNAIPTAGYTVIDTEVAFLEKAVSGQALFIRGQRLCAWARDFYDGRGIEYKNAPSPIRDLVETFSGLTEKQAEVICHHLGENFSMLEKVSAPAILSACYPIPLWDAIPSQKHAAEWLLWLDQRESDDAFQPILKVMTDEWKSLTPEFTEIYNSQEATSAHVLLRKWLDAQDVAFIEKFGEFPLPISEKWVTLLENSWRKRVVETDGEFLGKFIKLPTPWKFKQIVALATLDYFEKYPETLSIERYNQIARFVSSNDLARLNVIKSALIPKNVPDTAESVLAWFSSEYLPFREWQAAAKAEKSYSHVLELGLQFAKWYLDFYPKALTSKKHISFFKSKNLKNQNSGYVDLLVILDGLHALDAKYFKDCLLMAKGTQKLDITNDGFCFAPLPTVTDFAKGALVHGAQPTLMKELELLGDDVSEQQTPLPKLQVAMPGSLLIWRFQEPDRAYHNKNKSSTLKAEVEGELSKIAQKILDIVENVAPTIPLRITITTDHGRFLGISKRTVVVPDGMQAHGRAAWGQVDIDFGKTGYKIDGDLVYLSKERFGLLSEDAAVILTDGAFHHEKYDQEISTHGGLFPEEVIIPWMVFERNVTRPDLEFILSGDGRANMPGKVLISVVNPSSLNLTLIKVELNFGGDNSYILDLQKDVPGFRKTEAEIDLPVWPSSEQKMMGKALFNLRLPSGEEFCVSESLDAIKVTELYTRDKSLLEGLDL